VGCRGPGVTRSGKRIGHAWRVGDTIPSATVRANQRAARRTRSGRAPRIPLTSAATVWGHDPNASAPAPLPLWSARSGSCPRTAARTWPQHNLGAVDFVWSSISPIAAVFVCFLSKSGESAAVRIGTRTDRARAGLLSAKSARRAWRGSPRGLAFNARGRMKFLRRWRGVAHRYHARCHPRACPEDPACRELRLRSKAGRDEQADRVWSSSRLDSLCAGSSAPPAFAKGKQARG
jgi:hypothetical protein